MSQIYFCVCKLSLHCKLNVPEFIDQIHMSFVILLIFFRRNFLENSCIYQSNRFSAVIEHTILTQLLNIGHNLATKPNNLNSIFFFFAICNFIAIQMLQSIQIRYISPFTVVGFCFCFLFFNFLENSCILVSTRVEMYEGQSKILLQIFKSYVTLLVLIQPYIQMI